MVVLCLEWKVMKAMHAAVEITFTTQTSVCGCCHGCMKMTFDRTLWFLKMFANFRVYADFL